MLKWLLTLLCWQHQLQVAEVDRGDSAGNQELVWGSCTVLGVASPTEPLGLDPALHYLSLLLNPKFNTSSTEHNWATLVASSERTCIFLLTNIQQKRPIASYSTPFLRASPSRMGAGPAWVTGWESKYSGSWQHHRPFNPLWNETGGFTLTKPGAQPSSHMQSCPSNTGRDPHAQRDLCQEHLHVFWEMQMIWSSLPDLWSVRRTPNSFLFYLRLEKTVFKKNHLFLSSCLQQMLLRYFQHFTDWSKFHFKPPPPPQLVLQQRNLACFCTSHCKE